MLEILVVVKKILILIQFRQIYLDIFGEAQLEIIMMNM